MAASAIELKRDQVDLNPDYSESMDSDLFLLSLQLSEPSNGGKINTLEQSSGALTFDDGILEV